MVGGIAIDITELKQTEDALRESEARFRALAEASPALIWRLDPDGRSVYVNPQYLEYFGRTEATVLGEGWHPLLHPDDASAYLAAVAAAQRDRARLHGLVRVRDKHDSWRWMESYALPMLGLNGEYLGHVGMSLDITERKQFEDLLSEADARKNEFLAMLAHELRNPLAPIRNSLEIMRRMSATRAPAAQLATAPGQPAAADGLDAELSIPSMVQTMERQVAQLMRLVDDLVDVSRISRGRIELRRERVEIASVVHDAVDGVLPLCDDMNQDLTITLPPRPVYLDADPMRLTQVIGNLLSNACKYTDRGGRIWLTVESVGPASNASMEIRVRDNGIGIAAAQLGRIFDMFVQLDTSLDRSGSGLGIGLSLVRSLVESHGGTVEAHSKGVGQGSEFCVRLPMIDAAHRDRPGGPRRHDPLAMTARRVLVVDDNRDSADSLAMLLKFSGHTTQAAYDGLEAVEAATTFRPDVIFLDIGLPKLNGYEAARRIRLRRTDKELVLVALTGWGQADDRRRSAEAGFDAHLVKPVDEVTLATLLARLQAR
jgi:PAS domain S-box-containing protein